MGWQQHIGAFSIQTAACKRNFCWLPTYLPNIWHSVDPF